MADKTQHVVDADILTADQKLDAILKALDSKTQGEYVALTKKNEKLHTALTGVVAILEEISDSADVVAHTRGPLARQALALIKEAV